MFKHELNKWSLKGNRKYSFSTACRKEAAYILEIFRVRKAINMKQKNFIVCESICPLNQNWNEIEKHFFVITMEKGFYFVIEGYNFKERDTGLANIYKKLITYIMLKHHREIFEIRVCSRSLSTPD